MLNVIIPIILLMTNVFYVTNVNSVSPLTNLTSLSLSTLVELKTVLGLLCITWNDLNKISDTRMKDRQE